MHQEHKWPVWRLQRIKSRKGSKIQQTNLPINAGVYFWFINTWLICFGEYEYICFERKQ